LLRHWLTLASVMTPALTIKDFHEQRLHWGGVLPADEQRDQTSPQPQLGNQTSPSWAASAQLQPSITL
jgi:hypothetical protein